LFRNEAKAAAAANRSFAIKLIGTKSNRDASRDVRLIAGGENADADASQRISYLSASELVLTFAWTV